MGKRTLWIAAGAYLSENRTKDTLLIFQLLWLMSKAARFTVFALPKAIEYTQYPLGHSPGYVAGNL
jgi:hypothetical protein